MSIRAELEEEIIYLKEKLACCCCGKGIAYMDIQHTVVTSYRDGDEGYRLVNGLFNLNNPERPEYYQNLDYTSATPYLTLKYNNIFGTKDRFTDQDGLQVYGDGIVVDHLHKRMYTRSSDTSAANWEDSMDRAASLTYGGYDNWFLPTRHEMESGIRTYDSNIAFGSSSPLIVHMSSGTPTSTTSFTDQTKIYSFNTIGMRLFTIPKTTTAFHFFVRIFNESDLV